ncbi:hypothetical protein GCM10023188_25730 [Pontibacter saemangeumensis]|uniref:ATP-dependent Clp protease proteolytic subunit n=1 Tax=Pontibacter saemangeumensis TaxID=1084525 RepID=A0ABP8LR61_9BACT
MAKNIHIPIDGIIGEYSDEYGFVMPGFTGWMLDMYTGYDVNGNYNYNPDLEHITLHINSPGGDVHEGFAIYNKLLRIREQGIAVEVHVEGVCASIATIIALAASPGLLKAREASVWMVHKPMAPGLYMANADDLRKVADALDSHEKPFIALYSQKSGKEQQVIEGLMREERFMSATEAKAYGFIDEVLTQAVPEAVQTRKDGELKAVAFYNPKSIQTPTNKMKDEEKKSLFAEFKAWLKGESPKAEGDGTPPPAATEEAPAVVAESTTLEDGSSVYFEGELAQGSAVFADAEMLTALEDGTYTLSDGREIEVVEGQVANLTKAEEDDDAGAEASAQPDAVAALTKRMAAMDKAHKAEIKALNEKLDGVVPGSGNDTGKPAQNFTTTNNKKGEDPWAKVADNFKNKYGKKGN